MNPLNVLYNDGGLFVPALVLNFLVGSHGDVMAVIVVLEGEHRNMFFAVPLTEIHVEA